MFSKSKINAPIETKPGEAAEDAKDINSPVTLKQTVSESPTRIPTRASVSTRSVIASNMSIEGNILSGDDIELCGKVVGDIRAKRVTLEPGAMVKGSLIGEELIVNGTVEGTIRGRKVHIMEGAKVDGDVIHSSVAIEAGADFEGSIKRMEDPLAEFGGGRSPELTKVSKLAAEVTKPNAEATPPTDQPAENKGG